MKIYKHLTANDVYLEPFPFRRELSMEAYLVENERILCLDADLFSDVEIVETELTLKQGRKSNETDGRIDILATYSQEYIAVVELKLGQLEDIHLKQLEDYLEQRGQSLAKYPNILNQESTPTPKWIGVLVGSSIDAQLAQSLVNGYASTSGIQIAALTLQRFRSGDGNIYVSTETYFNNIGLTKDSTKYVFDGVTLGKGRLVLAVIKKFVQTHPNTTFAELEHAFPGNLQGKNVFSTADRANEIYTSTGRKRHFVDPEDLIQLTDGVIAVSSQWGISNINRFIEYALSQGFDIAISQK